MSNIKQVCILCGSIVFATIVILVIIITASVRRDKRLNPEKYILFDKQYNFGTVYRDQTFRRTFNVKNNSLQPLMITEGNVKCALCTSIEDIVSPIPPQKNGGFVVVFDPSPKLGDVKESGHLKTNIPGFRIPFEYTSFVCGIKASKVIDFGVFSEQDTIKRSGEIKIYGPGKYSVIEIVAADAFEVNIGAPEIQNSGADNELWTYRPIIATDASRFQVGSFKSTIWFKVVNSLDNREEVVSVPLIGYNKGALSIKPDNIFFGNVPFNGKVTKSCAFPINNKNFENSDGFYLLSKNQNVTGVVHRQKNNDVTVELTYNNVSSEDSGIQEGIVQITDSLSGNTVAIVKWMALLEKPIRD